MSVGRPVVSTDVGSIRDVVEEGETGHLVPPGDVEKLTKRIFDLLSDPLRAHVMGAAARNRVVARWSIDAMVHGYERLIESTYARKLTRDP